MTHTQEAIRSNQNPKDILVIIGIMATIFGFFSILFIG